MYKEIGNSERPDKYYCKSQKKNKEMPKYLQQWIQLLSLENCFQEKGLQIEFDKKQSVK